MIKAMPVSKKKSVSQTPYIKGSRIPITYFFNYIKNGYSISEFLSAYPWIKREDLIKKLEEFENKEITSRYVF